MERYMSKIKSSGYQNDIAKQLCRNEKENQRRQDFRISLESLWKVSDSNRSTKDSGDFNPQRSPDKATESVVLRSSKENVQKPDFILKADRVPRPDIVYNQDYQTQISVKTNSDHKQNITYKKSYDTQALEHRVVPAREGDENDNTVQSFTTTIDLKQTFNKPDQNINKYSSNAVTQQQITKYSEHPPLSVSNNKFVNVKPFPKIEEKQLSFKTKRNSYYPKDFRLPSIGSQDSIKQPQHESFTRRIDITIKSRPAASERKRYARERRESVDEDKSVDAIAKANRIQTIEKDSNESKVSSSINTQEAESHRGPVIKVSVTIGGGGYSGDPRNTSAGISSTHDANPLNHNSSPTLVPTKLFDPFAEEVLQGYRNQTEFIRTTNRLVTPPRPQINPSVIVEGRGPPGELLPVVKPITTKDDKKAPGSQPSENPLDKNEKQNGEESRDTDKSEVFKLEDSKTFSEDKFGLQHGVKNQDQTTEYPESQEYTRGFHKMTQTERLSTPSININNDENDPLIKTDEQLVAGILETTSLSVHKTSLLEVPKLKLQNDDQSDSGFSKSPFSSQSESSIAPFITSDILTAYQRERLACIWRNRSDMGETHGGSGLTPPFNKYPDDATPTETPRFSKQSPKPAQCAVQLFPLRENLITSIEKESDLLSYRRRLSHVIRRDANGNIIHDPTYAYGLNSQYFTPGVSFEDEERGTEVGPDNQFEGDPKNEDKSPVPEFMGCVAVGSLGIQKPRDQKIKPIINLPRVKWKKADSPSKNNEGKTKFPSIYGRIKQHKHGIKDCDCPDCAKKKVKKNKRLPKIKGANDSDSEDYSFEANKLKWVSEQQQEKVHVFPGYVPPRLILLSSKLHKISGVHDMIRKDTKGIIPIEYDFAKWNFTDVLDIVHVTLNEYHFGSRAKSILFLCQGGPGYAYILRNFVATPQKLRRKDFRPLVHFFRKLGCYLSKLDPDETGIHFLGFNMEDNKQGKDLIKSIKQNILPNVAKVEAPHENTAEERAVASLYFDYTDYYAWKTGECIEETPRSWSSLADTVN